MATKQEADKQQEFDLSQELEQLIQLLQGDLSDIDPDSALGLIDQWHGFLSKVKEPEFKELASELKELQKLLKSGKATGHEISETLIHLGESTTEVSSNAEKGSKQPVQRLGKQLRKAGTAIAKAEDQEYHEQLDALMEKAEDEELTALDPDEAIGAIDIWYNLLSKAEGEQFHAVADSLKNLKQTLKRGNAKPETVAKALSQVGKQTTELASEAPRGFKGILQKLGKRLNKASESLTVAE
jgi:ABC-type transporter Mla subunit MlaD